MKISKKVLSLILAILMVASCISVGVVSVSAASGDTIYLKNSAGWSSPTCYMWKGIGGEGNQNGSWPGVAMTSVGDNVYSYTLTDDYTMVVFNDAGGNKTLDRDYPGNNQIYDNSTGTWSVYDLDSAEPSVSASKKSGSTFKTATIDITVTATNADTSSYSVDGGSPVPFTGSAVVTMGAYTPIDGSTSITVTATNKNGTVSETYTYTKKAASQGGGGNDGSTSSALDGKYGTNPNGGVGVRKTISIDGDKSDWGQSMLIAQGTANDDPRVYRDNSMYEIAMDDYALYAAWDNDNLYLMWEMANVQDIVAPNDDFPLSQGNHWINNMPIFIAINTGLGNVSDGTTASGGTLWDSGITYTTNIDTIITCSTNNSNGPFIYPADENGKVGVEKYARADTGINMQWGNGKTLSGQLIGINGAYGHYNNRTPGDILDDSSDWVDFYELGHSAKLDMFYEMSVPLEKLDLTAADIETNGIGIMKISTFGTSGMDSLPYDMSMSDNADKPYSGQENNSNEKEDEDNITVPFARIGKLLGSGDTPTPTATPPQTYPPTEPATEPQTTVQVTEPVTTQPVETQPAPTQPVATEPTETTPVTPQPSETQPVVPEPTATQPQTTVPATDPDETVAPTQATSATEPQPTNPDPTSPPVGEYTYYVVGDQQLFGTNWAKSAENGMTERDGVYYLTKTNCPAGKYEFKIVDNLDNWYPNGTNNNSSVIVPIDGLNVTFCYDPAQGYGIASTDGEPTYPTQATEATTEAPTEATTQPPTESTQAPTVCNHSATKTTTTAATYFAKGKTVVTCAACGKVLKTTSIAKKVLKTPTVTVKAAKKSIKVTYKKKIKNATGFEVRYQIKGKKKVYTKTYKSNKKVTKVIRKLKSDKKYTVKVRAYIKSGNKIAYSKWTKLKTVKVK
ncbi:MAG: starch-binding protein [Ruminococcus sp.]